MIRLTTIALAENERGLLFRDGNFARILGPGRHRFVHGFGRLRVDRYDVSEPRFEHALGEFLVKRHPEMRDALEIVETGDHQVAMLSIDGKVTELVPPATRRMYWKGLHEIRAHVQDIRSDFEIPTEHVSLVGHLRTMTPQQLAQAVLYFEVPHGQICLLFVNGKLDRALGAGEHAFWRYNRTLDARLFDQRTQAVEVSGQEILTKDKVSLRVNLSASYRISDAELAATSVTDYNDALYRALQFALREAIGTKTLDELLADKAVVNETVEALSRARLEASGVEIESVGVKDLVLPGEMREILNQVVAAEKTAQANLIKRREETASTRALHNTARMLQGNPTLMRLKELEALEKVTERIDRITVFGGIEGVLNDLVKLRGDD